MVAAESDQFSDLLVGPVESVEQIAGTRLVGGHRHTDVARDKSGARRQDGDDAPAQGETRRGGRKGTSGHYLGTRRIDTLDQRLSICTEMVVRVHYLASRS